MKVAVAGKWALIKGIGKTHGWFVAVEVIQVWRGFWSPPHHMYHRDVAVCWELDREAAIVVVFGLQVEPFEVILDEYRE